MSFFDAQNPGIGGLDELTDSEVLLIQQLNSLGDPGADRILFWDESANSYAFLTAGSGLTITDTTITAAGGGTIDGSGTTDELVYWVDSDTIGALAVATYPSKAEIAHVKGVTSAIQTQLTARALTATTITIAGTANQITSSAGAQDLSANRTWTLSLPADVLIPTVLTVPNTGLHLLDTNASHDLIIKPGSNITADRTFTITTGDTDMIVDFTAVTDEYVLAYDSGTNTWRGVVASGSGANTALSNLAAVAINTHLLPDTDGAYNLGYDGVGADFRWSNLYLKLGGVVRFGDSESQLESTSATNGLILYADPAGAKADTKILLAVDGAGTMQVTSSATSPYASDGNALGTSSLMWSDIFLAAGAVVNFNNGNVTITHSAGLLTFSSDVTASAGTVTLGTIAGAIDAGGATSFEVPNGAGGTTVNAAGEVCVDTTSDTLNFYDGTLEAVLNPVQSKSITIENPTAAEDISMFYSDDAITITKMVFVITGSTSATTTIRHHTDRSNAGNEVVTGGTTANSTTTGNVVTSFNDATVPADSFVWLETTALSGTPTSLSVTIFYRQDA